MHILIFLLFFIFIGCSEKRYIIKGNVVDTMSEKPVQMATVKIINDEIKTSYTDKEGNFFFAEKKQGTYTISAYAKGFKKRIKEIEVKNKEEHITIKLEREFSLLTGVVVDKTTGEPLSAILQFTSMDEGVEPPSTVFSDPVTGLYRVELVPGHYRIKTEALGYKFQEKSVIVKKGKKHLLDFELNKKL